MYKRKSIVKILILGITIFFAGTSMVSAVNPDGFVCPHNHHTFGDKKMTGGVGNYGNNRRYYWTYGLNPTFKGFAANAVSEWVNTSSGYPYVTTSISIRETTNRSAAMFEFVNANLPAGILGLTTFWVYGTQINTNTLGALPQNYGWTQMLISTGNMTYYGVSAAKCKGTFAHELGHGMGLSHQNNNPYSIMCQDYYNRIVQRAEAIDCNAINHLY